MEDAIKAEFGRRVRQARHDRRMTLRVAQRFTGAPWQYIGQIERGKRNVSLLTITALARGLGVDP